MLCLAGLCHATVLHGAHLTTDGDFGKQTNGVLIGAPWNYAVNRSYGSTASQSPFTNLFAANAVGATWAPADLTGPYFCQRFPDVASNAAGTRYMNTDFMLPSGGTGGVRIAVANTNFQPAFAVYITTAGLYANSADGVGARILTPVTGVWYNLQLTLDLASNRYEGAVIRSDTAERTPVWSRPFAADPNLQLIFADTHAEPAGVAGNVGCRIDNWVLADAPLPAPPFLTGLLSTNDVSLYVPFEGATNAAIARGSPSPQVNGAVQYAAGRYGLGYLTGRDNPAGDGDELLYAVSSNVNSSFGTVALWVKPLGWNDGEANWHTFFAVLENPDGAARLWLYKYFNVTPILWLARQTYFQTTTIAASKPSGVWTPGQWTHLAASWAGPVMRLYVNGELAGTDCSLTPNLLRNFGAWMYVGGASRVSNSVPDTVLDELYVFDRPLTQREVATLYQLGSAAFSAASEPGLELSTSADYYPSSGRLDVRLTLDGRRPDQLAGLSCEIRVETTNGTPTAVAPATNAFARPDVTVSLAAGALAAGGYRARAELRTNDVAAAVSLSSFDVPAVPEWLGNAQGVPAGPTPPEPWTALTTNGQSASYWGGTVAYDDSLFPTQMIARGTPLLARPIRLTLSTNGIPHTVLQTPSFAWTQATGLAADFCASGTLGGITLSIAGHLEFDGFLWTTLSLPAQGGAALDSLELEIPLATPLARFQQGALHDGIAPASGLVTAWSYPLRGQPFLWLGSEEVGLQWCTGDNYDYENGTNQQGQVRLAPGPTETVLTVQLIAPSARFRLDRPLTYTFGLQTTPVKPLPARWRSYDLGMGGGWRAAVNGRGAPTVIVWRPWWLEWNTQNEVTRGEHMLFGYPVPDPLRCESALAGFRAAGEQPLLYWDMHALWRGAPEYAGWRSEWGPDNPPPLPFETASGRDYANGRAYRTAASFRDWAVWRYHKSMAENAYLTNAAGFYNDVAQGFWGPEPRVNSNGLVTVRHELLGVRELQKRMYVSMTNGPDHVILNHQSGDSHMHQLAFAHLYLNGEQYRAGAQDYGYQQILDFNSGVTELLGHKWGIPVMFLPELPTGVSATSLVTTAAGLLAAEHLQGLLLMHDALSYGANTHPLPGLRVAAVKELFGWDDQVEYIGYWKTAPTYLTRTADQSPVEVTVYRRPAAPAGHSVLFVVMNNSDTNASVTLTPNWTSLGVSPAPTSLVDAITAVGIPDAPVDHELLNASNRLVFKAPHVYAPLLTVPAQSGAFAFPVPARRFRVFASDPRFGEALVTNGVPLLWLAAFYPEATNWSHAALSDTDGDGAAAWQEHGADTDPTNAQSWLRVTDLQPDGSNRLHVYWSSRSTRTYSVLMATNLAAGWTVPPRTSNVPGSISGTSHFEDRTPPAGPAHYRIRVE